MCMHTHTHTHRVHIHTQAQAQYIITFTSIYTITCMYHHICFQSLPSNRWENTFCQVISFPWKHFFCKSTNKCILKHLSPMKTVIKLTDTIFPPTKVIFWHPAWHAEKYVFLSRPHTGLNLFLSQLQVALQSSSKVVNLEAELQTSKCENTLKLTLQSCTDSKCLPSNH